MIIRRLPQHLRRVLAALLCVTLVAWSSSPAVSHAEALIEALDEQALMIEEHGHAHGIAEHLFDLLHGHSHDLADHDHNPGWLARRHATWQPLFTRERLRLVQHAQPPEPTISIERPPRA
jgi:hypothetical protein